MHPAKSNEITQPARLFKVNEAASYLAISERTLWTLIKKGRIPLIRFGKVRRLDICDLDAFIRSMKGSDMG